MITETIKQIKAARATLVKDPPADFRVWAGYEMGKVEAKRSLEGLLKTLSGELQAIAIPVFVSGANALSFSNKMAELAPAAVVNLDGVYKVLFDAVAPSLGKERVFSVTQFSLVASVLRQMASENGLPDPEIPGFREPEVARTDEDLHRVIAKYADQAVGIELAAEFARNQAAEQAVSSLTESVSIFPVFLLNSSGDNQNALAKTFKRPVEVKLQAPDEVTEDAAIQGLGVVRSAVNPKAETKTQPQTQPQTNQKKAKSQ